MSRVRLPEVTALAIGTFNASVFAIVLLVLVFRTGGLGTALQSLSTIHGFALFAALWAASVFSAVRALRQYRASEAAVHGDLGAFVGLGARWGAVTGLIFLWLAALTLFIAYVAGQPHLGSLLIGVQAAAFLLVIPTPVSLLVGAMVGSIFGLVDVYAMRIARGLLRASGVERPVI